MKFSVDLILSLSTHLRTPCLLETHDKSLLQYCHQVSEDSSLVTSSGLEFIPLIVGHGLGARNPKIKTHLTDDVVDILRRGARESMGVVDSVLSFTARGHGASTGWQAAAASDPEQFTWNRLADDMIAIGNYFNVKHIVVSGCSMGSATAFYSALKYPEKVKALIMAKPPTGWEERKNRRNHLLSSASKLEDSEKDNDEKYHLVLKGAASSDFPPLEDLDSYQKITCPVLILAIRNDPSHPESTALYLKERIPQAELFFADNLEKAKEEWPQLVSNFLSKITI
jgi:fermentation-respiration switch protein FrsA (DUF1100 family)